MRRNPSKYFSVDRWAGIRPARRRAPYAPALPPAGGRIGREAPAGWISVRCESLPAPDKAPEFNEDAYACRRTPDGQRLFIAVADGVGSGTYSGLWARTLTEAVADAWMEARADVGEAALLGPGWLAVARAAFRAAVIPRLDGDTLGALALERRPGAATLAVLSVDLATMTAQTWAMGDSCVLRLAAVAQEAYVLAGCPATAGQAPAQLSCRPSAPGRAATPGETPDAPLEFHFTADDTLIIVSDAIGDLVASPDLDAHERYRVAQAAVEAVAAGPERFVAHVATARDDARYGHDDTTLAVVSFPEVVEFTRARR